MKIKLGLQLTILIFFVTFIALGINSYINYKTFEKKYLLDAYSNSEKDLGIVISNISKYADIMTHYVNLASKNENIQDGLNLISNYQDKKHYDSNIFDSEKFLILENFKNIFSNLYIDEFYIFDKDKELSIFYSKKDKGIISYKNNKKLPISKNSMKIVTLPKITSFDLKNTNVVSIKQEKKSFSILYSKKIFLNKKIVGYIYSKKIFNKINISDIIKNIKYKFSFLLEDALIGTFNFDKKQFSQLLQKNYSKEKNSFEELFDDKNYFYHTHHHKILDGDPLTFVSAIDKIDLKSKINELMNGFILSILASLLISILFSFIFIRYSIIKPLNNLLMGIKQLKNGKFVNIKSSRTYEFNEIANDFNDLTKDLQDSFSKIEQMNKFLEDIIDTVPIRIFWKDINGRFLGSNKLFLDDANINTKEELLGKTDFQLPWKDTEAVKYVNDDNDVIKNNKFKLLIEEEQTKIDGTKRYILTSKVPLKNSEEEIIGVLGVYDDITNLRKIQNDLEEKDIILLEQSKLVAMGEMLENIAHQWRQPLSVITTSSTGVLLNKEMNTLNDEMLVNSLEAITKSAQHLSNTIEDFRNFYKSDKSMKLFDIKNCILNSLQLINPRVKSHDIDLILDIETSFVKAYENELVQVFMNIINNAIDELKSANKDKKIVKLDTIIKDKTIIISFKDNAGGIKDDNINKIFEHKFTTKDEKVGTGLGLYMSKLIIEKIDGTIEAKNCNFTIDKKDYYGAEFLIILPLAKSQSL